MPSVSKNAIVIDNRLCGELKQLQKDTLNLCDALSTQECEDWRFAGTDQTTFPG